MDAKELAGVSAYLKLVSEAEKAVAEFYEACAKTWPEDGLWAELAPQEREHSRIALELLAMVEKAPEKFKPLRPLNIKALEIFIAVAADYKQKTSAMAFKKVNALAAARDIERSIIESRYDQTLSSPDPLYGTLVTKMISETASHMEKINRSLAALGAVR